MKPTKKYSVLFFDLDNTLWDFDRNSFAALKETFKIYGLNFSDEKFDEIFNVYERHNEYLWGLYQNQKIRKSELVKKRFSNTFDELGINGIDPDEFNTAYLAEMPKQTQLTPGATEILEYLSSKYRLFIITNGFSEVQHKKVENAKLSHYFEKIFISEEIKAPKPSREFFEYALKSARARKKESLIIGDDWDADIAGASNFGIDQVYYSVENVGFEIRPAGKNGKLITYRIYQLSQLKLIL